MGPENAFPSHPADIGGIIGIAAVSVPAEILIELLKVVIPPLAASISASMIAWFPAMFWLWSLAVLPTI